VPRPMLSAGKFLGFDVDAGLIRVERFEAL
jgi:hypothetical protein